MIDEGTVMDWLNSDGKVKKECLAILNEMYESGRLELKPTGLASVDKVDNERLVVLWGNESDNMTTEHFQIIPIKWLTDEEAKKKDMEKFKEENKIEIAKADPDYKKYLELKKKFAEFGL